MKTKISECLFLALLVIPSDISAATVVFDDFQSGSYDISSDGASENYSFITTPFANRRIATGVGGVTWSSTVNDLSGILSYSFSIPRGDPGTNVGLLLSYSRLGENLNLSGYNAFVFDVGSIVGSGQIVAYVGGVIYPESIPVSVNSAGQLILPFANMNSLDSQNPSSIRFWIQPQTQDFSITLNGIGVIPEPSTFLLSGLGVCFLLIRRRPE